MEERDLNLAEAAKHMPSKEARGDGVSAWDDFTEALETELAKDGYVIERIGKAARAPSCGD